MKALYFDCFSGISGDMTIGALLDIGIDIEKFISELEKLRLSGYKIKISKSIKNGITGTDVSVILEDDSQHHHNHEHENSHVHEHNSRNYGDICRLIDKSELKPSVKEFSKAVFLEIAGAEAKVHNKSIDEVHFHEVGAVDSIVDIVGTAICLELLGVERIYSSELHDGYGTIECRHGVIPVPVPAVMEMLAGSDIPLISEDVPTELVTPTGMALIKKMSGSFGRMPAMLVQKTGYGMGKRETGKFNALRVVLGELAVQSDNEEITVLETNIDDTTSEILGFVSEKLMKAGALDVFFTPIFMKKNRPAFMLTVLSNPENEEAMVDVILKETSTLGIRKTVSFRYCMKREIVNVSTDLGEVRLKIASWGSFKKASPEYEDCKRIAEHTKLPLKHIYDMVLEKARPYIK